MLGFRLIGTLGALAFTSAAYGQESLALLNAEEPAPAAELVDPLIHYPDNIIQVIFDATEYPEQIALAARYLTNPTGVQGKPKFNRAILALMQYPTLLQRLSTDLVWVSELGQAVAEDEPLVWAQLRDQRLLPKDLAEPVTVVPAETRVVYRSRPSSYRFSDPRPARISSSYVVHWDRHSHRRPLHRRHHHNHHFWGHSGRHGPVWHHGHLRHPNHFLYRQHRQLERRVTRGHRANRREFRRDSRHRPPEPYMSGTVFGAVHGVGPLR
jgi:hypothetical protein